MAQAQQAQAQPAGGGAAAAPQAANDCRQFTEFTTNLLSNVGTDCAKDLEAASKSPLGKQFLAIHEESYKTAADGLRFGTLPETTGVDEETLREGTIIIWVAVKEMNIPRTSDAHTLYRSDMHKDGWRDSTVAWFKAHKDDIAPDLLGDGNPAAYDFSIDPLPAAKAGVVLSLAGACLRLLSLLQNKKETKANNQDPSAPSTTGGGSSVSNSNWTRPTGFISMLVVPLSVLNDVRFSDYLKMLKQCADHTQVDYTSYPVLGDDLRSIVFITSSPYVALSYTIQQVMRGGSVADVRKELSEKLSDFSKHNQSAFDALINKPGVLDQGKIRLSELKELISPLMDWCESAIDSKKVPPPEEVGFLYSTVFCWFTLYQPLRDLFLAKHLPNNTVRQPPEIEDQDKVSARKVQCVSLDAKVRVRAALNMPLVASAPGNPPANFGNGGRGGGHGGGRGNFGGRGGGGRGGRGGSQSRDRGSEKRERNGDGNAANAGAAAIDLTEYKVETNPDGSIKLVKK